MSLRSIHSTRESALVRSQKILRDVARNWHPAGVAADGFAYPEGEWPGEPVGNGRHCRPEIGICTHAVPVEEGTGRHAGKYLVMDEAGEEVADDEIKRPVEEDAEPIARTR